jgi:hypothetical protein
MKSTFYEKKNEQGSMGNEQCFTSGTALLRYHTRAAVGLYAFHGFVKRFIKKKLFEKRL